MSTRNDTILLVEDNPADVLLTKHAFKLNHIENEVVVAGDGAEALDYLFGTGSHAGRDPRALPVMVLLDLNLPKVNGLEVLQRIRADQRTKLVPVVILTTSSAERDVLAGYEHGVNSYLQKPVDFDRFNDAVRHLGLYWLVLNVNPPPPDEG